MEFCKKESLQYPTADSHITNYIKNYGYLLFFFLTLPHHVVLAVLELTVVDQGGFEHRPACLCPPRARITRLLMVILI